MTVIPNVQKIMDRHKSTPPTENVHMSEVLEDTRATRRQQHDAMLCIATRRLFQHHPQFDAEELGIYTPILWHDQLTGFLERTSNSSTLAGEQLTLLKKCKEEGNTTLDCMKLKVTDCIGLFEGKGRLLRRLEDEQVTPDEMEEIINRFSTRYMGQTATSFMQALNKTEVTLKERIALCKASGGLFNKARQLLNRRVDFSPMKLHKKWNEDPPGEDINGEEDAKVERPAKEPAPNVKMEETEDQGNSFNEDDNQEEQQANDIPSMPSDVTSHTPILRAMGMEGEDLTKALEKMNSTDDKNNYNRNIVIGYVKMYFPKESHQEIIEQVEKVRQSEINLPFLRIPRYFHDFLRQSPAKQHANSFRLPSEEKPSADDGSPPVCNSSSSAQKIGVHTSILEALNIEKQAFDKAIAQVRSDEKRKQYVMGVVRSYVQTFYPTMAGTIMSAVGQSSLHEIQAAILPTEGYLSMMMSERAGKDIADGFQHPIKDTAESTPPATEKQVEEDKTKLPSSTQGTDDAAISSTLAESYIQQEAVKHPNPKERASPPAVTNLTSTQVSGDSHTSQTKKKAKKSKSILKKESRIPVNLPAMPLARYYPYIPANEEAKSIYPRFSTFPRYNDVVHHLDGVDAYDGHYHVRNGEWILGLAYSGNKSIWEAAGHFLRSLNSSLQIVQSRVFLVSKFDDLRARYIEHIADSFQNHTFLPTTEDEWTEYARKVTESRHQSSKYIEFKVETDYDLFQLMIPMQIYTHSNDEKNHAAQNFCSSINSWGISVYFRSFKPTCMVKIAALTRCSFIAELSEIKKEILEHINSNVRDAEEATGGDTKAGFRIDLSWETLHGKDLHGTEISAPMLIVYAKAPFKVTDNKWDKYTRGDTADSEVKLLTIDADLIVEKVDRPLTHNFKLIALQRFEPGTQAEKAIRLQQEYMEQRRFFEIKCSDQIGDLKPNHVRHNIPNEENWTVRELLLFSNYVFLTTTGKYTQSPIISMEYDRKGNWQNEFNTKWLLEYNARDEQVVHFNLSNLKSLIETWVDPWDLLNGIHVSPLGYTAFETTPPVSPPQNPPHQVQYNVEGNALEQIKKACMEACVSSIQQNPITQPNSDPKESNEVVSNSTTVTSSITNPSYQDGTLQDIVVNGMTQWANKVAHEPLAMNLPATRLLNQSDIEGACKTAVAATMHPTVTKVEAMMSNIIAYHHYLKDMETRLLLNFKTMIQDVGEDEAQPSSAPAKVGAIVKLLMDEMEALGTIMIAPKPLSTDPSQCQRLLSDATFDKKMEEVCQALHNVEQVVSLTLPSLSPEGERFAPQALADLLYSMHRHSIEGKEREQEISELFEAIKDEIAEDRDHRRFQEYQNWNEIIQMVNAVANRLGHFMSLDPIKSAIDSTEGKAIQETYDKIVTVAQSMNAYHTEMMFEKGNVLKEPAKDDYDDGETNTTTGVTVEESATAPPRLADPHGVTPIKSELAPTPNGKPAFEEGTPIQKGWYLPTMRLTDDFDVPPTVHLDGITSKADLPEPALLVTDLPDNFDIFADKPVKDSAPIEVEDHSIGRLLLLHTVHTNDGVVPWVLQGISEDDSGDLFLHASSHADFPLIRLLIQTHLRAWTGCSTISVIDPGSGTHPKPPPVEMNPNIPPDGEEDASPSPQLLDDQFKSMEQPLDDQSRSVEDNKIVKSDNSVATITTIKSHESSESEDSGTTSLSSTRRTRSSGASLVPFVDNINDKSKLKQATMEEGILPDSD